MPATSLRGGRPSPEDFAVRDAAPFDHAHRLRARHRTWTSSGRVRNPTRSAAATFAILLRMVFAASTDVSPWWSRRTAVFVAAAVLFLLACVRFSDYFQDDAYIYLRYADNVVTGNGVVFNPGERVEGYTSPLWLAELCILVALGVPPLWAPRLLGITYGLALLAWIAASGCKHDRFVALVVAANASLGLWAVGGLETVAGVFHLLLPLALADRVRNARAARVAGVLLGLASLARPELAVAWFVVPFAFAVTRREATRWRYAATMLGTAVAAYAPYELFRIVYFGHPLPNTFVAKRGAWDLVPVGLDYLATGSHHLVLPLVLWMSVAIAVLRQGRVPGADPTRFRILAVGLLTIPLLAYVVWSGGDHMRGHRMLLAIPVACLWAATPAARWGPAWRRFVGGALFLQALVWSGVGAMLDDEPEWTSIYGRAVGEYIREHWNPQSLIALNTAGSTPYYAGNPVIDMLGLTEPTIAAAPFDLEEAVRISPWATRPGHRRGHGAHVLDRKPDYIIIGSSTGSVGKLGGVPMFLGDVQIFSDPRFQQQYIPRSVVITLDRALYEGYREPPQKILFAYFVRRDVAHHDPPRTSPWGSIRGSGRGETLGP